VSEPEAPVPLTQRITLWMSTWGSVVAPISLLSALLFYFGYVSSRAQFEYFGIDVDTIGLDTQHYVMRSPQFLLVPLLVVAMAGAGWLLGHHTLRTGVKRVLAAAGDDEASPERAAARRRLRALRWAARTGVAFGALGLAGGLVLIFSYAVVGAWPWYPLVTPALVAAGAALLTYGFRLGDVLRSAPPSTGLVRAARVLVVLTIVIGVLWTTATVAQMSGRGIARDVSAHLDRLPQVVLDTKERLYLKVPGVVERKLDYEKGQTFRYRYRGLRLLVIGGDRLFLVPEAGGTTSVTLVVPFDSSVRVQFIYEGEPQVPE
jgi:hypothetical protein